MEKLYPLHQLLSIANSLVENEGLKKFSVSTLRHYTAKDILPKPTKEGREVRYGDQHIDAMISLRRAQHIGVTSRAHNHTKYFPDIPEQKTLTPVSTVIPLELRIDAEENTFSIDEIKKKGLKFLESLGPPTMLPVTSSTTKHLTGFFGLMNNTQINAEVSLEKTPRGNIPEIWSAWEISPGIRLQVSSMVLEDWTPEHEKLVINTVLSIKKK
jgi:hypothetical protein